MIRTLCWILAITSFCLMVIPQGVHGNGISWTFIETTPKVDTPLPKTYAEARARSLSTGLPLVVWVGDAVCPACVQRTKEEFVHWVTPVTPSFPDHALVVGLPERGELIRIGTMTAWPDGHITTIRKALELYRTHRQTTDQRSTPYRGASTYTPAIYQHITYPAYSGYSGGYGGKAGGRSRGRGGCST